MSPVVIVETGVHRLSQGQERSLNKSGKTISGGMGEGDVCEMNQLTETPLVLKRPMQPDNTRVTGTQSDEGVLLCEGCWEFAVASEMALIEYLDGVLVLRSSVFG